MKRIIVAIIGAGIIALVAGMAGQSTSSNDPLLAEVRALRADLNQAAGTSIRTQLLVARLQLQEQRINTVAKQLEETRTMLSTLPSGLLPMQSQLKQLEEEARDPSTPQEHRRAMDSSVSQTKAMIADMQKKIAALTDRESGLAAMLASEQGRWADFNTRLDDIERDIRERR